MKTDPVLDVRNASVAYGHSTAVRDVSVTVGGGEIVVLVGANGAGKSSLLKAVAGLVPLRDGEITVHGRDWAPLDAAARVGAGLAYVPEHRAVFASLTVEENLRLVRGVDADDAIAVAYERFPSLRRRSGTNAGNLSGGEQQMLALARCVVSGAGLVLLDEPTLGLAPAVVDDLADIIRSLAREGRAVVVAEQNLQFARAVGQRFVLLRGGAVAGAGGWGEFATSTVDEFLGVDAGIGAGSRVEDPTERRQADDEE